MFCIFIFSSFILFSNMFAHLSLNDCSLASSDLAAVDTISYWSTPITPGR